MSQPALLRQVMNTGTTDVARRHYEKDRAFSYKPFLGILGAGLVTSEGHHWRRQRSLVMKAFRVDILDEIVGVGARAAQALCGKIDAGYCSRAADGEGGAAEAAPALALSEEFRHLTLRVIVNALMDLSHEESDRVFPVLYLPIMEEANRRTVQIWRPYLPSYSNLMFNWRNWRLSTYVRGIVASRWRERAARNGAPRERHDILERVLDATATRIGPRAAARRWLPGGELQQLASEFKTFVLAGHETSAALMTWALHELCKPHNAEALRRVREEADSTFGSIGADADAAMREAQTAACAKRIREGSMDFTLAVLKETLRLHTVVPVVTRTCVKDDVLGGYAVPRGATIVLGLEACHHDPAVWPDPLRFDPERFTGGKPIADFSFVPFIDGVRNCLGQHLALLEVRTVLGLLLQRYDFAPLTDREGERASAVIPIAPKHGMRMRISERGR